MTTVVGFDGATAELTIAIMRDGEVLDETSIGPVEGHPRHAVALLPEVERLVDSAGGWDAIDRIAVGAGPGSYTGLRICVATARALAQSAEKPLASVSSLAALARGMPPGRLCLPVIDARRTELFAALYDDDGAERWRPFVEAPEALAERVANLDPGPLAVGDGSLRFRHELETAGAVVPEDADPSHRIRARYICELAAEAATVDPGTVEPVYLRAPDAERWIERDSHTN